jgi:TM2 domain-containing membrane protein YozV
MMDRFIETGHAASRQKHPTLASLLRAVQAKTREWVRGIHLSPPTALFHNGAAASLTKQPTFNLPMSENTNIIAVDGLRVDLRNRPLAAFLAWLIPGAGHFYQGRYTKGSIFFVCILSAWILGFALGGGHVVYASWQPGDKRWHVILQAGVGAAALPAFIQGDRMRRQTGRNRERRHEFGKTLPSYEPLWGGFMAPPHRPVKESEADEVSAWYARRGAGYEMGTWYTVIAGLLNILVIYDAYGGPLAIPISGRRKPNEEDEDDEEKSSDSED